MIVMIVQSVEVHSVLGTMMCGEYSKLEVKVMEGKIYMYRPIKTIMYIRHSSALSFFNHITSFN